MMKPIKEAEAEKLIAEYQSIGGVLDYFVFEPENNFLEEEIHFQLAKIAMETIEKRVDDYFEKLSKEQNKPRSEYWHIKNDFSKLTGNPIFVQQFFGPHFHIRDQRPMLRGITSNYLNDIFYYDEVENQQNAKDYLGLPKLNDIKQKIKLQIEHKNSSHFLEYGFTTKGYAEAFFNPPYGLGKWIQTPEGLKKAELTRFQIGELFLSLNQVLFSDVEQIKVNNWNIDCSNFFDGGKEWWGSFFWTIQNPLKNHFIAILASATD